MTDYTDEEFNIIENQLKNSVVETKGYVGIKPKTIIGYIGKLKFFNKNNVLNNNIVEYLNTKYPNISSRSAYQIAISGTAKHSPYFKNKIGDEVIQKIFNENKDIMEQIKGFPNQNKSEKEEENWVSLKELKKLFKEKQSTFNIQDQLLIACYILIPPVRLDFANVLIIRNLFVDEITKLPTGVSENQNYIKIYKKSSRYYADLVLKEYKTSSTYGEYNNRMPKAIVDLIKQLPINQTHLFEKRASGPFASAETFGVYLRNVFNTLTGKNISVDLLRHIYLTDFRKNEKTEEQKLKISKQMMNNVDTQTKYLKKDNPNSKNI